MKKIFALMTVLLLCLAALCGCSAAGGSDSQYSRGGATLAESVENLDIEWTAGKVRIAYHSDNTVMLEETSRQAIPDDQQMRWQLDGKTLKVLFNKPGQVHFTSPEKELTITLPEGMKLKKAGIAATSADISVPELRADETRLQTTSGDMDAAVSAPKVECTSTSGDIKLKLSGRQDTVKLGATSGSVDVQMEDAAEIHIGTTSGGIRLAGGEAGKAEMSATSGNIHVSVARFAELKIGATSGSVNAELPAEPGFSGNIHTTSGDVLSTLPLTRDGDRYACGDGSGKLDIGTTSGDVSVSGRQ